MASTSNNQMGNGEIFEEWTPPADWVNDSTYGLELLFADPNLEEYDNDDLIQETYNTNEEIVISDSNLIQSEPLWEEISELAAYGPQWWLTISNGNGNNSKVEEGPYSDERRPGA